MPSSLPFSAGSPNSPVSVAPSLLKAAARWDFNLCSTVRWIAVPGRLKNTCKAEGEGSAYKNLTKRLIDSTANLKSIFHTLGTHNPCRDRMDIKFYLVEKKSHLLMGTARKSVVVIWQWWIACRTISILCKGNEGLRGARTNDSHYPEAIVYLATKVLPFLPCHAQTDRHP